MKLPSFPFLASAFVEVLRRFPLVMAAAFIGTGAIMYMLECDNNELEKDFIKIALTCSLGLSAMLCAALVNEKWQLKMPLQLLPHLVALGLVVLYYFSLRWFDFDSVQTPVRYFGLNLAAHLGVAFIPYLDGSPVKDFWEYNKRLFGNFMVGAFYSLVIFAGLAIAILAVDQLFNLDIDENIYGHLFVIIAGVFNTAFFLAHFPKRFDFTAEATENQAIATATSPYTTSFKNLTKFILIPIVLIYFLILYAFSTKILVTWELPEGWVGKLVLGFSVAGILTYLLNFMLVEYDDSALVKGFRKWFFYVLLPMVVLLFVAIGRRMYDYGVTEPRYVVAIAGIWLLLMSLYFIASRKDNIKFIPISLAFFSVLTVIGPFSAFRASERNQTSRLMAILEKNNMLKDGKAVPASDTLSTEEAGQFRGGIEYLTRNGYFEEMAPIFGLPKDSVPDWQATDKLISSLGIANIPSTQTYCYINFKERNQRELGVAGYEYVYQVYSYDKNKSTPAFTGFTLSEGGSGLQYYLDGEKKDSFNLVPFCKQLHERIQCNASEQPDSLATYHAIGVEREAVFHATSISYEPNENWKLREFSGQILLRKKQ